LKIGGVVGFWTSRLPSTERERAKKEGFQHDGRVGVGQRNIKEPNMNRHAMLSPSGKDRKKENGEDLEA